MSDPHQPGTPAGTDPDDTERRAPLAEASTNVQDVAQALGLGTEQQRF